MNEKEAGVGPFFFKKKTKLNSKSDSRVQYLAATLQLKTSRGWDFGKDK